MKFFYKSGLILASLGVASLAHAATLTVNEPDDALSDGICDVSCTLRDAVEVANNNADTDNTITFSESGTYFVSLEGAGEDNNAEGDLDILNKLQNGEIKNLTITGAGIEPVIIDGSGSGDRVIHVVQPDLQEQLVNVSIENVTITGGNAGDDRGGAIYFEGGFNENFDVNTLTIAQTHIVGNQAAFGGGVFVDGEINPGQTPVTINNSTFSENRAFDNGGGFYVSNGIAAINNSTFFNNEATNNGGAIFATNQEAVATLGINSSTIFANIANQGAGLAVEVIEENINFAFANTILAGNISNASGPNCFIIGDNIPTMQSDDYNIFGELDSGDCPLTPAAHDISADDQNDSIVENALADNGGPTPTLALTPDSIAIDQANPEGCDDVDGNELTSDQRVTFARVVGAACDVGAFEADWANIVSNKTASASDVEIGDSFSYTITVTNEGPNNATNIQVVDNLPVEVEFVSVTPDDICSHLNGVVTCNIPSLNNGESIEITIQVIAVAEGNNVINNVTVTAEEDDPLPEDNDSSAEVKINPLPEEPAPAGVLEGSGELFSGCSLNTNANAVGGLSVFAVMILVGAAYSFLKRRKSF
ncbi:MAG: DUF11 domain-containing protein [Deltaproteobacteria bacterium]|nr:DUF11 domain-containing protein [Deltaproteobacteria bacterium]